MPYFDDHEDEIIYGRRRFDDLDDEYRPLTRCNRCGSRDVRWRQQTGKWVLFNLGPGEHVCQIDDPFKVLP